MRHPSEPPFAALVFEMTDEFAKLGGHLRQLRRGLL
jgi:hypothetical protein